MASGPAHWLRSKWVRRGTLSLLVLVGVAWIGSLIGLTVAYQRGPDGYLRFEIDTGAARYSDYSSYSSKAYIVGTPECEDAFRWRWTIFFEPVWRRFASRQLVIGTPRQSLPIFRHGPSGSEWELIEVNLWIPFVLLAALVIYQNWPAWQRRRRLRGGRCERCGYDLRASPERCPECGLVKRHSIADVGDEGNVGCERGGCERVDESAVAGDEGSGRMDSQGEIGAIVDRAVQIHGEREGIGDE